MTKKESYEMTEKQSASPSLPRKVKKNNLHFAITEKAVIRSNQLTMTEKAFYTTLKSYFYTNSPRTCQPSLTTLAKDCNLSRRAAYYLKKSLESKGLIKCKTYRGRTHTNSYKFPLVTGSVKEKLELLIFLDLKQKVQSTSPFNKEKVQPTSPKEDRTKEDRTKERDDSSKNYNHRELTLSAEEIQELKTIQFVVKGKSKIPKFNPQEISNLTPRSKTKIKAGC